MLLKAALSIVGTVALAYLALCGWMYAKQRELVYFPQSTRVEPERTDFALRRDGVTLRGWVVNRGQPGAIVYFGGNAESIEGMREDFARWFPEHSTYLVAYRGFGASDGSPTEAALLADALAVFDAVQARHPGAGIIAIGRSLGSGVAGHLASQRPVARLALITPFDSLADVAQAHYRWLPVRRLMKDRYDAADWLAEYRGPVLVIRAGRDEVIPAANTNRLIASLATPPQVIELPAAGHNTVGDDPRFGEALRGFVE
ncbi:alpha/beta hydrolase [Lysobacter koreensis]|uniref:Alpha/beta hydrolase n=1 Tax=Lysobacter koreensis TaxID=266122 RepID=A0ABW2YKJ0_9GAMM